MEESGFDAEADLATLEWLSELGVDETISEDPINRFEAVKSAGQTSDLSIDKTRNTPAPVNTPEAPDVPDTRPLVAGCADLAALRTALEEFEGCALRLGARNLVFADGNPAARLMIVGEAPGREEDQAGKPFVGRAGQLLDRMLVAIGMSREAQDPLEAVYITNVLPWRPPQNRDPLPDEVAMLMPFLKRHIELVAPEVLILMGNTATRSVLETTTGITRMRGTWAEYAGIPVMPMFHPAALLRDGEKKRPTWVDLLTIKARLEAK